jgi:opacity protein-like surface antigen
MRDILPKGLLNAFNELQDDLDLPVRAVARLTNTYVTGNVRVIAPTGPVRPFVGGGLGLAHLTPKFEVTTSFGLDLGDVFGAEFDSQNKLMSHVGGGVSFNLGEQATLDTGYRYMMVDTGYSGFNITGVNVRAHIFYVAFGSRW